MSTDPTTATANGTAEDTSVASPSDTSDTTSAQQNVSNNNNDTNASHNSGGAKDNDDGLPVPITLITGYLGSGKTTLLTRILTEDHGKRLAVIQNEFGEVGIDDALVKERTQLFGTEEENFCMELQNGCICCTVRTDLAKAIQGMVQAHLTGKNIDGILIETTGVADPGPVVQTLFADSYLKQMTQLDGILTVVDAKHILQHLNKGGAEAVTQVGGLVLTMVASRRCFLDCFCMLLREVFNCGAPHGVAHLDGCNAVIVLSPSPLSVLSLAS